MKAIHSFFRWVSGLFGDPRVEQTLRLCAELTQKALPIVELVAVSTPTRADDALLALFRNHAIPGIERWLAMPVDQRGPALAHAASVMLMRQAPAGTPRNILDTAVQTAYTAWNASRTEAR